MQIGLHLTRFNWPEGAAAIGPRVAEIARRAEAAGFAGLWPMDHFFQIPVGGRPAEEPMLEGYSLLSHVAAVTKRLQLGTLVTGVSYRHPGILVKTVTTLDILSGGRAWLGIGAAWNEREHLGLGAPFPPLAELGVEQAMVMASEPLELATIDLFGEHVVPEAARLVPSGREKLVGQIG